MTAPIVRPPAVLNWTHDLCFTAIAPQGHVSTIDGDSTTAASPVTTLLFAAAACSGADVVSILLKKKVKLTKCQIEISGKRREEYPKRFTEITMVFRLAGEGLTEVNAARSVALSIEKYCSVVATFNPDIPVKTEIVIE
jgi:putative redox protein